MIRYRVVVKGLGTVYDGDSGAEARRKFQLFGQAIEEATIRISFKVGYAVQELRDREGIPASRFVELN